MIVRRFLAWLMVAAIACFTLLPLLSLLRLAVTPETEIFRQPPTLLPATVTGGHFLEILAQGRFWRQLGNSLFVCGLSTAIALTCGALGAYGLTRRRFRWRDGLLLLFLVVHLAPGVANMASIYRAAEHLHALNSLLFVALVKSGGITLAIWILMATFRQVPVQLEQAAQLDGWSPWQTLRRVTLPLAGPGLLTAGLLLFIQSWNTFFLPFILLEDPRKMTLTVGLYEYFSEHGFEQGHVAAFMLLSMLPVVLVFLLFRQRLWRDLEI